MLFRLYHVVLLSFVLESFEVVYVCSGLLKLVVIVSGCFAFCFALLNMFEVCFVTLFLALVPRVVRNRISFTGDKTCDALAPTVLVSAGASLAEVAVLTNSPEIAVELQCRCR